MNYYCRLDEARQPLSRKVPIASSKINPYRMVIVARLIILAFFLRYRILHPVHDAIGLWLTSIVCEIWFAISWILDQFPKWLPIDRETYLDRLSLRSIEFSNQNKFRISKIYMFGKPTPMISFPAKASFRKKPLIFFCNADTNGKASPIC